MSKIISQNDDSVTEEVTSLKARELPTPSNDLDRDLRDLVHFTGDELWKVYDEKSLFNQAVLEAETNLQVPREMAITSALGAMAVACQSLIDVQQPSGNKVNTSLMLLTIAESGERKTTVEKQFFREIKEFQTRKLEDQVPELKRYQAELSLWLEHKKVLNALYKKARKAVYEETDDEEDNCNHPIISTTQNWS